MAISDSGNGAGAECHLILGGGGFIGRHVAMLLVRAGHRVVLASRKDILADLPPELARAVRWARFDMAAADWDTLLDGIDVVHHFAWSSLPATAAADPAGDLTVNVAATLRLLEAARRRQRPPRVVFTSSGGTVYGKLDQVPVAEDHPLRPITAYGAGKAAVELYFGCYRTLHGVDCRIGRVANPFGVGQDVLRGQGAVTAFLHAAMTDRPIQIWGDGEVVRDYIHVSDAAIGLVRLACAPRTDGPFVFNLASGQGVSLNGIVAELEQQLGRRLVVLRSPGRAFDVPVSVLDVSRAQDVLGWSPILSFPDGIGRTIADMKRHASLSTL